MSWGWWASLALALGVVAVIVYGVLRSDPERNPAPAGYAEQACAAFDELEAGTDALAAAVAVDDDPPRFAEAAAVVDEHVARAGEAIDRMPAWPPGEQFEELLASLIITLLEGSGAVPPGEGGLLPREELSPEDRVEVAENLGHEGREILDEERLGFGCASN
ncbi:MAG: hypothetical protein ACRDGV_07645 [Candidatus Limnocylindria bacterium]